MATPNVPEKSDRAVRRRESSSPLSLLHSEVDRLFDDFMSDFGPWRSRLTRPFDTEQMPSVDVSESDKEVEVKADLPGMDEKDIEVSLSNGVLTIKGERKAEKEDKDEKKSFHRIERSYGLYRRSISLPCEIDENKVKASFSKGVLTVTMPKTAEAKSKVKKIAIKGS